MDGTIMGDGEGTIEEYKEGGRHPPYVSSPSNYTAVFVPTDHQLLQYFTTLRTRVWPQTASQSVQPFLQGTPVRPTNMQTDTRSTQSASDNLYSPLNTSAQ